MAMYQVNKSRNFDTSPLEVPEIIEATGMAIFVISSLFLNISVCSVILKSKLLRRRTTNIFIINLGISNILITMLIMPFSCRAIILRTWDYGGIFCTVSTKKYRWALYKLSFFYYRHNRLMKILENYQKYPAV